MARHLSIISLTVAACCMAQPGRAQDDQADQPAVITADTITFDETLNIVVASGNVEIWQGLRILRADRVTYNQRTEVVTATGNVVLAEPSGDVVFAEYAELDSDLTDGFVDNVSALLADDSRLIGNSGVRTADGMELERAVYSPCNLCPEDPRRAPIWQIRAVRVIHDSENKDVIYRDAFFDFYGVPLLYTPYFRHPDPTVDRRSGFLFPSLGTSTNLGPFFNLPYYWDISPEQDATFELGATRDAGAILGGEYRRRFEDGELIARGSLNRSERENRQGVQETDWRWHFFGDTRFDLTEHWRAGADINRASDDTYLDVFNISEEDVLTSRAYAEGFYGLSYAVAEGYVFQDLRPDAIEQATVAPWLRYEFTSAPGDIAAGQVFLDVSLLNLIRDGEIGAQRLFPTEGVDTRRLSVDAGWQRTVYSDAGFVTSFTGAVRGDLYSADDLPVEGDDTEVENGVATGRLFPRATVMTRYPLVRQQGSIQQLIEPIVAMTVAPTIETSGDIPNNDSIDLEFDEINLFSESRYPGIDRIDDGTRVTYGLRTGLFGAGGGSATVFLGQSYRITGEDEFPEGTGLDGHWSDYVGRITLTPSPVLNLDYRFRLDEENLEARRHELTVSGGRPVFNGSLTYTYLDDTGTPGAQERREEALGVVSSRFSQYWTALAHARYDLERDEAVDYGVGLTYQDECLTFGARFVREFTDDRDATGGDTIYFTLALRNLGELPFNFASGDLFN